MAFGIMAAAVMVVAGCAVESDNPAETYGDKGVVLEKFSASGCKTTIEMEVRGVGNNTPDESVELTATERGSIYVAHNDVVLNCGMKDFDASVEVDGNKITVTEYGDASVELRCICPFDFGYDIGPLQENVAYELTIVNKYNNYHPKRTIRFVYTPALKYKE